eukprot:9491224-Pyramimonas_sp.AAC.1
MELGHIESTSRHPDNAGLPMHPCHYCAIPPSVAAGALGDTEGTEEEKEEEEYGRTDGRKEEAEDGGTRGGGRMRRRTGG